MKHRGARDRVWTEGEAAEQYCDSVHPKQMCQQELGGRGKGDGMQRGGGHQPWPVLFGKPETSCCYSHGDVTC